MTQDWRGENNFVHPPPDRDLLNAIAQKLREQPAAATEVEPYWSGELWFRELRELVVSMEVRHDASAQACPEFLEHWSIPAPKAWSLVYFRIEPLLGFPVLLLVREDVWCSPALYLGYTTQWRLRRPRLCSRSRSRRRNMSWMLRSCRA